MRSHILNLLVGGACLACGIAYTIRNGPLNTIAICVALGLANLAFVLAR